jgi:hypothetical protein
MNDLVYFDLTFLYFEIMFLATPNLYCKACKSLVDLDYVSAILLRHSNGWSLQFKQMSKQEVLNATISKMYCLSVFCFQSYDKYKFISDLRKVGSFLRVLRFPPPIRLTATI